MSLCRTCGTEVPDGLEHCPKCGAATAHVIDGRYVVKSKLGSGAMGVVYLAEDVGLNRRVAIKVISPVYTRDPYLAERFRKEAQALAQVRNEHVVQVHAFGKDGASYFFAMEYIDGKNLDAIVEEYVQHDDAIPLPRAMTILAQTTSGLAAVHARGIVHRDVKPSNIVIENDTGRPVLVDFGLAQRGLADSMAEQIGVGTPLYMAPEQCWQDDPPRPIGPSADLYSLGCTAYELFTGKPVFDVVTYEEVLRAHLLQKPAPLSSIRPELAPLDGLIEKLLAKDPDDRWPGAAEFGQALAAVGRKLLGETAFSGSGIRSVGPPRSSLPEAQRAVRVLVVDDDPAFVRFAGAAARVALAGFELDLMRTESSIDALELFENKPPDLVVLDYDMPNLNGAELLGMLRMMPKGASARVLVASAKSDEKEKYTWRFAALGVNDFIQKPVDLATLARAIAKIADRSGWRKQAAVS